ncbi:Qat anti-phage system TatD family nuclease QatD [Rhizobium sp. BR 314]|uniref:Qat anti-phage system TatD family nuclease QatD n=1 Tax=Rhizobium sp. BR 314 TaxID=3040013 RepID=UPI0039BFF026
MIDFHCHLDLFKDPAGAVAAADESGYYVLSVTTTPKAFPKTAQLAKGRKRIKTALGLHPEIAHLRKSELGLFDRLILETPYVGEVGLDGSKDHRAHFEDQQFVFNHILSTCRAAGGRVLSIHSRGAACQVLDALDKHAGFGSAVLHWFSGTPAQLRRAADAGCWFSVGCPMFRSAKGRELVSLMPRDRVLTETDAPFTTTSEKPYDGSEIGDAIIELAGIWNITPAATNKRLADNLRALLR